jgi:hypothetical protein
MTDEPPQISIIDARLAEIDRRLGSIQTGLAVENDEQSAAPRGSPPLGFEPSPGPDAALPPRVEVEPDEVPSAARQDPAALVDELRRLAAAQEQVLESTRELLRAYEAALTHVPPPEPAVREFSVSAGPFPSTEALRGFERTLSEIPQVREVAVRGYEGGDRAIVDVHLFDPKT